MARSARVVEHLRLRGESESAVRHVLPALEDAFRTASLPDSGARLICVRRLRLGRLPSNGSAQSVALLIEQRFAEAGWSVVHASEAGADSAEAVWFQDAFEAHETAALRLAAGQPLDAWFWPMALPKVVTHTGAGNLRTIAFAVAAMEEAPRALPEWTTRLVRAGYRQRLISALRPGDGPILLRAAGVSSLHFESAGSASISSHETGARRSHGHADDDRATFVEAMTGRAGGQLPQRSMPIAARPVSRAIQATAGHASAPDSAPRSAGERRRADPQPAASRERTSKQGCEPSDDRLIQSAAAKSVNALNESAEAVTSDASYDRREERRAAGSQDQPWGLRASVLEKDARGPAAGERQEGADVAVPSTSPWHLSYAAPTTAGGLLFLLPVLERVGFADWAAGCGPEELEPDALAAQILHLLLSRLRVDEEDPAWKLAETFRLSAFAEGVGGPAVAGAEARRPEGCVSAATWLTRCRRYLRRRVRIGLASLVQRRARMAIAPTHVDVFFPLNAADVRVRRAGLDIDPGWVAWFGRVVTFHYEDRPWN